MGPISAQANFQANGLVFGGKVSAIFPGRMLLNLPLHCLVLSFKAVLFLLLPYG